jgi:hypothetical protein
LFSAAGSMISFAVTIDITYLLCFDVNRNY